MTFGEVRKAVAIIVGGVPIWGAAASAENGIDQSEWWALAALLSGALLVYLTPNDPPPKWDPPHRPEHLDRGTVNWGAVWTVALILLLLHLFGVIPHR